MKKIKNIAAGCLAMAGQITRHDTINPVKVLLGYL